METSSTNAFFNHDYERALIGAFLQDSNTFSMLQSLDVADLHGNECMEIVRAMKDLLAAKAPIDVMTVREALFKRGTLDAAGGAEYLIDCVTATPTTANTASYYRMVRELSLRRKLYTLLNASAKQLIDPRNDVDVAMDDVRTKLRMLTDDRGEVIRAPQIASTTFELMEQRMQGVNDDIRTDLPELNYIMGGFPKTELTIIAARPGVGKSAFSVGLALYAGLRNVRSLVVSREMSAVQYGQRVFSYFSEVEGAKIRRGKLQPDEVDRVCEAANTFAKLPIGFTFRTRTIEELRMVVQHELDTNGLDVLFVDYLQLMDTKQHTDNDAQRLGRISGGLKSIAMDFNIPVIAMAQVRRIEGRVAQMPILSELKGSGDLEQDADNVIFLHHPEAIDDPYIDKRDVHAFADYESHGRQYVVVNVAKHRQGDTGSFGVIFEPAMMRYTCLAR